MRLGRWLVAVALMHAPWVSGSERSWVARTPEAPTVSFRGLASFDEAGHGTGAMLYPAPGLAGFVAALITHGVLVDASKRMQKTRIQEQADEVLKPFASALAAYTPAMLVADGVGKIRAPGPKRVVAREEVDAASWVVESVPEFAMTQDKRALVLDNGILLFRAGDHATPAFRNVVRVVSAPADVGADADAYWSEGEGRRLRDVSAAIWAESVDAAISQLEGGSSGVEKTVRYVEGGTERMERSQVLAESCGRLLIRTLRGELMSVPSRNATSCPSR